MAYTLGEAAKATGISKTSIRRALDKGRISGTKSETGEWRIDPAELHRVYPMVGAGTGTEPGAEVTPADEAYQLKLDFLSSGMTGALKLTGSGQELLRGVDPSTGDGAWLLIGEK